MEKRYQVFISSTFIDLVEERAKISQTLMEMDCIPAGMEVFPAIDEEQFEFIKKVIDDCDYYILVIGGRYGSISTDGLSFTEKEFDYAISKGIKVIAFLHGDVGSIPANKSELNEDLRVKLESFRMKVANGRLVKYWTTANELPGLVSLSLNKTIKTYPAVGWVRGNSTTSLETFSELNDLRKENELLKATLSKSTSLQVEEKLNLAGLDDEILIKGKYNYYAHKQSFTNTWELTITWKKLFSTISPFLLDHPSDSNIQKIISTELYQLTSNSSSSHHPSIDIQDFQTIKIHLTTLELIAVKYSKTTTGNMGLFWSLTSLGREIMMSLRSIKKEEK